MSTHTEVPPKPRVAPPDGSRRRERLRAWLQERPPAEIGTDEVEAHLSGMPSHYWESVSEAELLWGLQTVHRFLSTVAGSEGPPTMPILDWRHRTAEGITELMLCTWDRCGLLAKAAACLSAVQLSIRTARVFTRADHIVLDLLVITDAEQQGPASAHKLQQAGFLMDGALSNPPRFASVWACSRHKFIESAAHPAPQITFDNRTSATTTLLRIETHDRLGLLYDVLQCIADAGLHLREAQIQTRGAMAYDIMHVVEAHGRKLTGRARLASVRRAVEVAITGTG